MGEPVWSKITPDGKPFGYKSDGELEALKKLEEVEKENKILRKEVEQLRKFNKK
ncbi:MAG: hypothetical protein NTW30_05600 [Candidatus Aenigmarchaeota archaeon]|nr:hypothetical protein [Candidatus Aenigmarchaeota archaeon]